MSLCLAMRDPVIEQKRQASLTVVVNFMQKQHTHLATLDFQRRKLLNDGGADRKNMFIEIAGINEQILHRRCEIALVVEVRSNIEAALSEADPNLRGASIHALFMNVKKEVPHISDECYTALADLCLLVASPADNEYQRIFMRALKTEEPFKNRNLE